MEIEEILKSIGLTEKEIRVYMALISLGKTTTGPLIDRTGIPSSKIYFILNNLSNKGLVTHSISSSSKYYSPESPNTLKLLLKQKINNLEKTKIELNNLIKEMEKKISSKSPSYDIKVYEGLKGIETLQEEIIRSLNKGDKVLLVGRTKLTNESLIGYFNDFHKRRSKKGIIYRVIKNSEAKKFKFIEHFPNTKIKYLPEKLNSPTLFQIFKKKVVIMIYEPFSVAFMIENDKISQSFKSYFEGLWKIAKS